MIFLSFIAILIFSAFAFLSACHLSYCSGVRIFFISASICVFLAIISCILVCLSILFFSNSAFISALL
ncbi:hypothetical protein F3J23_19640 [Chryseobacterium sp. Tr-659]|nr:hypothetical protein [Chryseobacterium sp. Tr-659]